MSKTEAFDLLILGSGQGGKQLAWHFAKAGKKVATIERQWVGGSCPAVACLPSKNEMWSAKMAHIARNASQFGTSSNGVETDMAKVWQRKQNMVGVGIDLHLSLYKASGAELIMGSGRFTGPKTIEVALNSGGTRVLTGKEVVVNLGSRATIPDVPGLKESGAHTHIEILEVKTLPSHLIILGGGYVGIEMAQIFRRFGSKVTILEPGPQLMSREDPDVAAEIAGLLKSEGIDIAFNTKLMRVEGQSGDKVTVHVQRESREQTMEGSHLLVATGRIANTSGIGLEIAGVKLDADGFISVDKQMRTSSSGVWAIGECAGSPQFTHVSVDDFRIVRDAMAGGNRSNCDRLVPYVLFTDPPLAHVGLSEREAKREGIAVRVAKLPMSYVIRTLATDEAYGFMKVLVSATDDRILGFTMIGAESGEVMTIVQTAMLAGLPYTKLRDAVIAHLTVAEGLGMLLDGVPASRT